MTTLTAPKLFTPELGVESSTPNRPADTDSPWPHLHVRDIGHGLNNLLSVISGYSELMLAKSNVDEPTREMLQEVKTASDRATILSNQLLAISRKQRIIG